VREALLFCLLDDKRLRDAEHFLAMVDRSDQARQNAGPRISIMAINLTGQQRRCACCLAGRLLPALGGADRPWRAAVESPRLLEEPPPMDTELEKLEAEALKLAPGERAALAQRLLASLEEDTEIEEAWAQEVERRIAEVESGAVQLIPIEEALARVRAALK
jgi:putative addiction module component (TIGR02574 family)